MKEAGRIKMGRETNTGSLEFHDRNLELEMVKIVDLIIKF